MMSLIQIIDKLCHVTTVLSELVREQSNVIAQSDLCLLNSEADSNLDGEAGGNRIAELQQKADDELDEIEMALRRI